MLASMCLEERLQLLPELFAFIVVEKLRASFNDHRGNGFREVIPTRNYRSTQSPDCEIYL